MQFLQQIDMMCKSSVVKKSVKPIAKTPTELMGDSYLENITMYRDIFPPGMLPTGAPSRSPVPELVNKFKQFFTIFTDYTWEQILTATTKYVAKFAENNYEYMKNSTYFISKEDRNGNRAYELASRIDMLDQGELPTEQYYEIRQI